MIAARPTLTRGKQTVSEFFAVVRQQLDDLDGARFVQRIQEGFGTGGCFVSLDGYKDPARGPIDLPKIEQNGKHSSDGKGPISAA